MGSARIRQCAAPEGLGRRCACAAGQSATDRAGAVRGQPKRRCAAFVFQGRLVGCVVCFRAGWWAAYVFQGRLVGCRGDLLFICHSLGISISAASSNRTLSLVLEALVEIQLPLNANSAITALLVALRLTGNCSLAEK